MLRVPRADVYCWWFRSACDFGRGAHVACHSVADVDVDAADEEQSDVGRAESADDEVKYDETAPMIMVGGADALELAYHAARGVEPTEAWVKT